MQILNIGLPIALLIFYFKLMKKPKFFFCGLGAITPLLIFFLYISAQFHASNNPSDDLKFSYHAMWQMAGWAGPILIIIGLLIGRFLLHRKNEIKNYLLGLGILPLIWGIAYAVGNT